MSQPVTLTILGSTGSVGLSAIDLIKSQPQKFKVQGLTAYKNAVSLIAQALLLKPEIVAIGDVDQYGTVSAALAPHGIKVVAGEAGIEEVAACNVDLCLAAIVGIAGLKPIFTALEHVQRIAIANKEPLVAAGNLLKTKASRLGVKILPVDSEHNAIFQVFEERNRQQISRLILTASGGPFRDWSLTEMSKATPAQAVKHPNWSMGAKISVDSATMMNKGLEVIEAHHLFDMSHDKIDVLLHPQSIVHSMVEYADGSILAQLGAPDMRTPIASALAWPERMPTTGQKLDLFNLPSLEFKAPDLQKFPCLALAYDCLRGGQDACLIMNAANEIAVEKFLAGAIDFGDIYPLVARAIENRGSFSCKTLEEIIEADRLGRELALAHL